MDEIGGPTGERREQKPNTVPPALQGLFDDPNRQAR
jgi:hypothetical protein